MKLKETAVSTKNFVKKHRVAIAIVGTTAVWTTLHYRYNVKELNEFLKEHNLFDEYYTPEDSY